MATNEAKSTALTDSAVLAVLAAKYAKRAGSWTGMAIQPALEYTLTVGENNTREKTAGRADVKAGVSHALSGARDKVLPLLEEAWQTGTIHGAAAARRQAKAAGLPAPKIAAPDPAVYASLLGDVERILSDAEDDMASKYIEDGQAGLEAAQRRAAYRMSLAVEAAAKHAAALTTAQMLAANKGTYKEWAATSPVPCSHCERLDGTVVPWDKPFPTSFPDLPTLGVYTETLMGPPRHPHCRCVLIVTTKK